jgi:hypothetical protein
MAVIELVYADDKTYSKPRRTKKRAAKQTKSDAEQPTEPVTSEIDNEASETAV